MSFAIVGNSADIISITKEQEKPPGIAPYTKIIDKIYIKPGDVFDLTKSKENKSLFRLANTLHANTRQDTISEFLLFKSGDFYDEKLVAESERLLRALGFIIDASIRPTNIRDDKVDIIVKTRDTWSLSGGVNFSHKGGKNTNSVALGERNFLGFGKRLKIERKSEVDRTERSYAYGDDALFGSRHKLDLEFSDNSDGQLSKLEFELPFFAISAENTYGVKLLKDDKVETFTDSNETARDVKHSDTVYESFLGYSYRFAEDRSVRLTYGYTFEEHDLTYPNSNNVNDVDDSQRDSYPWVSFGYIEERFRKMKRINFLNKIEDINFGRDAQIKLGWSDEAFGAYESRLIVNANYDYNFVFSEGKLLSQHFAIDGKIDNNEWVDSIFSSITRYYYRLSEYTTNYISLNLDYGTKLSRENFLLLDGETGLRGYPLKLQRGDKRFLVTVEQRYYSDYHLWQLAYVGGVVFMDIGRAWEIGDSHDGNKGVMKDIGVGLRLSSSRIGKDLVVHLDLSYPLDGDNTIANYQFIIDTATEF